jgi:hypothetical protein
MALLVMRENNDILAEAEGLIERNEFSRAIVLLRNAARMAPPSGMLLANLTVAEEHERVQFSRELARTHPGSLVCKFREIGALMTVRGFARAAELCSVVLPTLGGAPEDALSIRQIRFQAEMRGCLNQHIVEDFKFIWDFGDEFPRVRRVRRGLILEVAGACKTDAIPIIEALAGQPWVPDDLAGFLRAKLAELRIANRMFASWTSSGEQCAGPADLD